VLTLVRLLGIEAPSQLGEFAHGSFSQNAEQVVETKIVSGGRTQRLNPTVVNDYTV
jgi:hypothetical protein